MDLRHLNGYYQITFQSDIPLPPGMYEFGHANLVVRDGRIAGMDVGGCLWHGHISFRSGSASSLLVNVNIDPRPGQDDAVMFFPDGSLRREPIDHCLDLRYQYFDGRVILMGRLSLGPFSFVVNGRRVGVFDNAPGV